MANDDLEDKKKPHRKRHSGRKAEKKANKKENPTLEKHKNPKAFTFNSAVRAERRFRRTQDLETKKQHIPLVDRTPLEPPPVIVAVVGPPKVGKTTLIQCLIKSFTRQPLTSLKGPITIVSGKKRRLTIMECNNDINSMIDIAKVADLVLLLIDASFGFEMEIFEFLNISQVHGMPRIMGVLTHLDMLKRNKQLKRVKKTLKHRFWTEVYDGAKLFYLSGLLHGEYLRNEVKNLGRFISVIKFRPLLWRTSHPYVLVDRLEDITSPELIRQNPVVNREVCLYGFVRGIPLNKFYSIHIPGCGDFKIKDVMYLPDPCPLPDLLTDVWNSEVFTNLDRNRMCGSWSELWTMTQLSIDMKRTLEAQGVLFQGVRLSWHEVQQEWPQLSSRVAGPALGALLAGEPLVIGAPLPQLDHLYISRVLEHKTVISHSVFNLISDRDRFVLKGFSAERLRNLRAYNSKWQECLPTGAIVLRSQPSKTANIRKIAHRRERNETRTKWTEWTDEIPTQPTSENENLHWLSMESGILLWEASEGNTENIIQFIEDKNEKCKMAAVCSHDDIQDLLDWRDTAVVISDIAGMGKSTFITHAAHYIKERRSSHWVIVLRMSEGRVINNLPDNFEVRHILEIFKKVAITNQSHGADIGGRLFEDVFRLNVQTGKFIVMIDGVDEVCPAHKAKTIRLLYMIKRIMEIHDGKLWVAARTVLQDDIRFTLISPNPLKLRPFTKTEQQQYLVHRWKKTREDMSTEELFKLVVSLLEAVSDVSGRGSGSLCDVPLYTRLLAEAYEGEDITLFQDRLTARRNFINRATLYKKFISKTLGTVWTKAGIPEDVQKNLDMLSDDTPLRAHKMYAALQCFNDRQLLGTHYESLVEEEEKLNDESVKEKTAKYGLIVHVLDGTPEFLHLTIAEFLAASWLVDNYASLPDLTRALYAGQFGEVRVFFDSLLAEGCQLHEAAIAGRQGIMNTALQMVKEQGDSTGGHYISVLDEDAGGRSALHLAAICGHVAETRRLLAVGADPGARDRLHGWTPLRYADACVRFSSGDDWEPRHSFVSPHLGVVEALLAHGAHVRDAPRVFSQKHLLQFAMQLDYQNIAKRVILKQMLFCCLSLRNSPYIRDASTLRSLAVLDMLVKIGCSVNKVDSASRVAPLHIGAEKGFTDVCELLLAAGANVNARDALRNTPLHIAANGGHLTLCEVLLSFGADPFAMNEYGDQPQRIWKSSEQ